MKYTKTATFIFPLLDIPKELFKCEVKNSFGKVLFQSRFVNAYLYYEEIVTDICVFIVIRNYQDPHFREFYTTLISLENYVDDFEKHNHCIMLFSIREQYLEDFYKLLNGEYSKISTEAKSKIFKNSFFSGNYTVLPMIFSKAVALKEMWEKELSNPHIHFVAELRDQEVWSIMEPEKETLTLDDLKSLGNYKDTITKVKEHE
jgi:hypothetical protein